MPNDETKANASQLKEGWDLSSRLADVLISDHSSLTTLTPETLLDTLALLFKGPDQDSSEVRGDLPSTPQKEGAGDGRGGGERAEETGDAVAVSETLRALRCRWRAIAVINTILYWKTTSVVQEAVQFCVTVCEFSVANSLTGVRKMLPLVWSTDAAIKDVVVQAYRRLYLNPQGDNTRSWSFLVVAAACSPRWCRFCGRGSLANERPPACTDEQQCCFWEWLHERRGRWSSVIWTLCALGEKFTEDFLLARDTYHHL
nr:condensin complex subunit 1-like [Oncorhynchus nerka]